MKITRSLLLGAAILCMAAPTALAGARGGQARTARPAGTTRPSTRPARTARPQRQRMNLMRRNQRQRQNLGSRARAEIARYKSYMESTIRRDATPPFHLVPTSAGVEMTQVRQGNYKQNITPQYKVKAPGGKVSFTALLPVSGHVGQQNAANYAKNNVYNVEVRLADGTVQRTKVKSTGYVTQHQMEVQLQKGTNYVRMWPDGSAGVAGFKSGREIELVYDGN